MKRKIEIGRRVLSIAAFIVVLLSGSCTDDFEPYRELGEGEGIVRCRVEFASFSTAELGTRTEGTALDAVRTLHVLGYDKGTGALVIDEAVGEMQVTQNAATETGERTAHVEFELSGPVRYGEYYLYAVVNVDEALLEGAKGTREGLKGLQLSWDSRHIGNNSQMIGLFTNSGSDVDVENKASEPTFRHSSASSTAHARVRRVASKLTISFNTSGLNDNIWIYVRSATIKDIPLSAPLWNQNRLTAEDSPAGMGEGETIYFCDPSVADSGNPELWPALSRGSEPYGNHSHDSPALFFYENCQGKGPSKLQDADGDGIVDNPGRVKEDSEHWKDRMKYGTWVEVQGWYRSHAKGNEGEGPIVFRFMLGKDIYTDYNAERNHHFKLTLNFRGNANDVDWHIDYHHDDYDIYVPHPFYISYLYGESVEMSVTINGKLKAGTKITAEIIENNWKPYNADASDYWTGPVWSTAEDRTDGPWNGFLSLRSTNSEVNYVGRAGAGGVTLGFNTGYLKAYWYGGGTAAEGLAYTAEQLETVEGYKVPPQGYREYESSSGRHIDNSYGEQSRDSYTISESSLGGEPVTNLLLPLYTRALFLQKSTGYSGGNPYFTYQRRAVVRLTAVIDDGTATGRKVTKDCEVMQVRRLINPKGVYRQAGNNAPFHVSLARRLSEDATEFVPFVSEGRWSAEIEAGDANFINLDGKTRIEGATGEFVEFTINFRPTTQAGNRYAVILVKYHDYTCNHRIMVRQGYSPAPINDGSTTAWHCFNLRGNGWEAESPIEEGSLFKYGNFTDAIDAESNGPENVNVWRDNEAFTMVGENGEKSRTKKTWSQITEVTLGSISAGRELTTGAFAGNHTLKGGGTGSRSGRLARYEEWAALRDNPGNGYGYGVCYADESTQTHFHADEAFSYYYGGEHDRGMRGTFIYSKLTGRNIFFPAGRSAHGHRLSGQGWRSEKDKPGILRYALRSNYYPSPNVHYCPLFWRIREQYGSIYWIRPINLSAVDVWSGETVTNITAWDMNISSYDFNHFSNNAIVGGKSDGCYVRLVE